MKSKQLDVRRYKKLALMYVQRLGDIRFTGQLVFVVIVLLVTWSGVKSVQTNYGLLQKIAKLKQENQVAELQNENTKLQKQYYDSPQYLELTARQNFGLAAAGEKELVVPKTVALSYTDNVPANKVEVITPPQPTYVRNMQAWVNFFLHRPQSGN